MVAYQIKRRLWLDAVFMTPIMAMYGVIPFYSMGVIDWIFLVSVFFVFIFYTFSIWTIHILIISYYPKVNNLLRFILAYIISASLQQVMNFIAPEINKTAVDMTSESAVNGLLISFLPNILITVLCNSIVATHKKTWHIRRSKN